MNKLRILRWEVILDYLGKPKCNDKCPSERGTGILGTGEMAMTLEAEAAAM